MRIKTYLLRYKQLKSILDEEKGKMRRRNYE